MDRNTRSPSPERMRASRSAKLMENGEPINTYSNNSRPTSKGGHHSDERINKKRMSDDLNNVLLDSDAFHKILKSPSPVRTLFKEKHTSGLTKDQVVLRKGSSLENSTGKSSYDRTPNARLGDEVPTSANQNNIFGSSQILGCQGDFCQFDVDILNSGESETSKLYPSAAQPLEDSEIFTRGFSKSLTSQSNTSSSIDSGAPMKIALRSIIQARQEMPLVKLQLERHRRNEVAPYVIEDTYQDLATSGKLPAHYYQDVPCCLNCFKIYNIIDKARAKAMNEISKRKKLSGSRKIGGSLSSSSSKVLREKVFDNSKALTASNIQLTGSRQHDESKGSLLAAIEAIDGLTKLDVAEIRTMVKPPAAVEVVIEAVMILLTGKIMTFKEAYRLLGGGEVFLQMLKDFDVRSVTAERLRLIEPYVDNPLFRPENVQPISLCASKFCAWVHGVVHAARWEKGETHPRIDVIRPKPSVADPMDSSNYLKPLRRANLPSVARNSSSIAAAAAEELSFVQKLEKIKTNRGMSRGVPLISRQANDSSGSAGFHGGGKGSSLADKSVDTSMMSPTKQLTRGILLEDDSQLLSRSASRLDPGPYPSVELNSGHQSTTLTDRIRSVTSPDTRKRMSKRESKALQASQKKTADRLAAPSAVEGGSGLVGGAKQFRCSDGITVMPYMVLGKFSLSVTRCSFLVIHDFFDTCDATGILFKPTAQRHDGCQVFCFNYPGQSNTTWPRLSAAEKERGGKEPVFNNEWIADRLHELLCHADREGDLLISSPFHLVGIGNGACIAAYFMQRYGNHRNYVNSIRSLVSINGFLYPDPQLSSILHSAYQVFESTPHSRPDIPVSYWSTYVFSEEYLQRVNPNLALNIYTAVSNPITNEGRTKIAKGALQHFDLRGALSPDYIHNADRIGTSNRSLQPTQIPIILLQSTEDSLVNAANVDAFLTGRSVKHLWSHMLNVPTESQLNQAFDSNAHWVGKLSSGPSDYHKFSTLGKMGIKMLLESLRNPRGAFTLWTRTGHQVQQEYKTVVLDLFDLLACPTDEYVGINMEATESLKGNSTSSVDSSVPKEPSVESTKTKGKDTVLFKLESPKDVKINDEKEISDENDTDLILPLEDEPVITINRTDPYPSLGEDVIEQENSIEILQKTKKNIEKLSQSTPAVLPPSQIRPELPALSTPESNVSAKKSSFEPNKKSVSFKNNQKKKPDDESPTITADAVAGNIIEGKEVVNYADTKQKKEKEWVPVVPDIATALELESELEAKRMEYLALLDRENERKTKLTEERSKEFETSQKGRKKQYETEDAKLLQQLQTELDERQRERDFAEKQRRLDLQSIENALVKEGLIPAYEGPKTQFEVGESGTVQSATIDDDYFYQEQDVLPSVAPPAPVVELNPLRYDQPAELPQILTEAQDVVSKLDRMLKDEEDARKKGIMNIEDYEKVKFQMAERQLDRDQKLRHLSEEEKSRLYASCAIDMQRIVRGFNGRNKANKASQERKIYKLKLKSAIRIQCLARGIQGRLRFNRYKRNYLANLRSSFSATEIQRVFRGHLDRKYFTRLRRYLSAIKIQKCFRGHLGRTAYKREQSRLKMLRKKQSSAAKIQSVWRMKVAKEEFRSMRIHTLAAIEIQRCYRGYLGRKKMLRRKQWESTTPGPERIKLGLQFIEESKVAFERQQEEIDALHRAQERAEARISLIHAELTESEKELVVLERELQEIDQIERDLSVLTHERNVLVHGVEDAAGMPRTVSKGKSKDLLLGKESNKDNDPSIERRRKAEAYALEMTIQLKRAEREKKRQELEIEFASVFQDVEKKKKALERLELSLADMEATRERKDREFKRLQKNLMQLLMEQKQELDELREKGIELETATANSAAAAIATAQKAKEHEKRSTVMFSQTEELMKFQFMSMSLSYFSSLNMLKSLRDMNADTTSAAVAMSADAAATAASSAAAANLPNFKKLNLGANDFIEGSIQKKKAELQQSEKAEKELSKMSSSAMPISVRTWTITDVAHWLESLSLSQYVDSFVEASIDGPFLMELREEDLVQVLGIKHKLHVRKILISRDKLRPLSKKEMEQKEIVEQEEAADALRRDVGVPDLDTVFSQARNGRIKRVEESLNLGFPIEAEDERGNTLLLIATQNRNKRLVEMLLIRGAKINHQNAQGNTALHFALSFDSEGVLAEYLIEHGADDTIENIDGRIPYDGLA